MKKIMVLTLVIVLFGFMCNSFATSPQPEEVKPGQTATVCTTHIVYTMDREKGILQDEASSTFTFEASMPKKDVLENITMHISDELNERKVSAFRVECKFPR